MDRSKAQRDIRHRPRHSCEALREPAAGLLISLPYSEVCCEMSKLDAVDGRALTLAAKKVSCRRGVRG
jgi:hypothetical protein